MGSTRPIGLYAGVAALLLLLVLCVVCCRKTEPQKVSEFGRYQGYATREYDGARRTSDYLTLSCGTRLAYDLFVPTKKGVPADRPMPVLFQYTPYGRAWTVFDKSGRNNLTALLDLPWYMSAALRVRSWIVPNGNLKDALSRTEWLGEMVTSGYAVIVVDRPGTGASFGQLELAPAAAAREADEILNWIAAQEWCDGNIGMFGDSIQAQIQFQAASTGNPHLKAIMPATTWIDNYSAVVYPGGVRNTAFARLYARLQQAFNYDLVTALDKDQDGALLAQAREERREALLAQVAREFPAAGFRDDSYPSGGKPWLEEEALYPLLEQINRSGIPVCLINGWYDIYARDNFSIYANLTVPKRLLVRPTDHSGIQAPGPDVDIAAEAHRWFDYWLKGIDNGIMDEAPIHYYLQGAGRQAAWQATDAWPLPSQQLTRHYLGPAGSGTGASANDGTLVLAAPTVADASDSYTVDYATTTGPKPHWTALAMGHDYPNMRARDARALTYTTLPLENAVEVIGHPVVHLWLRSDAPDLDVFAYLEEVDGQGNATYISQGNLRASHRALGQARFPNLGLPWHDHFRSQLQPIPAGEPVELVFDLLPTAYRFAPDKRLRITLAFADAGNFETPVLQPTPRLQLLRDANHPSYVELPIKEGDS